MAVAATMLCLAPEMARAGDDVLQGGLDAESLLQGPQEVPFAADRGFLYNDTTRLAEPGRVAALARFSLSSGDSLTRAFATNVGAPGALLEAGGEVGLAPGVALVALGAQRPDATGPSRTGAIAGLRFSLLPRSVQATQLVASAGVLRDLSGNGGAWGRLSLGHDEGRARLALSVHGEHVFNAGRDGLDVMVTAGATVRLVGALRAGLEYVGQDLEGVVAGEAEGGARHIAGGTVSAAFLGERLSIAAGPAVALGAAPRRLLGRMGLNWLF